VSPAFHLLYTILEYTGAILGVLGAILVTSTSPRRRALAFGLWVISNIALGYVFIHGHLYGLLCMQSVYLVTAALGLANNLRAMRHPPVDPKIALELERESCSRLLASLKEWQTGPAPGNTSRPSTASRSRS
jgi:hypothetical protein